MKTRYDFVSNSSSTSFTAEKPADVIALFRKWGMEDVWNSDEYLRCRVYGPKDVFKKSPFDREYSYNDWDEEVLPDGTVIGSADVYFDQLFNIDENDLSRLTKIMFETAEENDYKGLTVIGALYNMLKRNGIKTDTSCSEISFPEDPAECKEFLGKLLAVFWKSIDQ